MSQTFALPLDGNDGMSALTSDISSALLSLQSCFSGTAFPTSPTPVAGQLCYRTDLFAVYQYDGTRWLLMPAGTLDFAGADVASDGTTDQVMETYSLAAALLARTGMGIEIEAAFSTAANANNKLAKLCFGATDLCTTGTLALNDGVIRLRARVWRTGASTQRAEGQAHWSDGTIIGQAPLYSAPAETLSGSIAATAKGTTGTPSDLTLRLWRVSLLY